MKREVVIVGNIGIVTLTKGRFALIDSKFAKKVEKNCWSVNNMGYAQACINYKTVLLHRMVLKTPSNMDTDHINGNILDCRLANLRVCTTQQNLRNRSTTNNRKYKGTNYVKKINKWAARIMIDRKMIYLGCYKTEKKAAQAYNKAALKYFGRFAKLNNV